MNSLHQIIDCIPAGIGLLHISSELLTGAPGIFALFKRRAQDAICFDAGSFEQLNSFEFVPELTRLPYPTCWIEATIETSSKEAPVVRLGLLLDTSETDTIFGTALMRGAQGWDLIGLWESESNIVASKTRVSATDRNTKEVLLGYQQMACSFLTALNCVNVTKVAHQPPSALQRKRLKNGRQPLFSYWTLDIALDERRERSPALGGSHASPRVHLRRGHTRRLSPNRYTWVNPHVVGNSKLGMVHKDYSVAGAVQ